MAMMVTVDNKMQMKYEKGAFSFNKFSYTTTDEHLFNLAGALNAFQADPVKKVRRVKTMKILTD